MFLATLSGVVMATDWGVKNASQGSALVADTTIVSAGVYLLQGPLPRLVVTLDAGMEPGSMVVIKADSASGDVISSAGTIGGVGASFPIGPPAARTFILDAGHWKTL